MCNDSGRAFVTRALLPGEIVGRRVLEVGSHDVNGSARSSIGQHDPAQYLGVDLMPGPGVDEVVSVYELEEEFGPNSFDVVLSTEMLEHVEDWRQAVTQMKRVTASGGVLVLTTRSRGFRYHAYPHDYWRFEQEDLRRIFADFDIELLESDSLSPGVFLKATKKKGPEQSLEDIRLYSIVYRRRVTSIGKRAATIAATQRAVARCRSWVALHLMPSWLRRRLRILLAHRSSR